MSVFGNLPTAVTVYHLYVYYIWLVELCWETDCTWLYQLILELAIDFKVHMISNNHTLVILAIAI